MMTVRLIHYAKRQVDNKKPFLIIFIYYGDVNWQMYLEK